MMGRLRDLHSRLTFSFFGSHFFCNLFLFMFLFILSGPSAEARVFDLKSETFAIYLGGTLGTSNAGGGAYNLASGTTTQFDKTIQSASSAEFGFLFSGSKFNLALGVEYLMPRTLTGINGTTVAGVSLFTLNTTLAAFMPEAAIELQIARTSSTRGVFGLGAGWASVTLANDYTMTTAGTTALGVGSYKEMASSTAWMYQSYIGWEFTFSDTATCVLQGGYRYLKVPNFTATQSVTAISGAEANGSPIVNMDGSARSVDLGGVFAGIVFRFFL
jgi:hypothetical protein